MAFTKKLKVGDRLFTRTASQMAGCIRAALRILGLEHKAGFTWKAARSGRATELAAQGMPLAQIMDLGEWKSSAILNYIDESAVDAAEMVRLAEVEDDEDDTLAGRCQRLALGVVPRLAPLPRGPAPVASVDLRRRVGAACAGLWEWRRTSPRCHGALGVARASPRCPRRLPCLRCPRGQRAAVRARPAPCGICTRDMSEDPWRTLAPRVPCLFHHCHCDSTI